MLIPTTVLTGPASSVSFIQEIAVGVGGAAQVDFTGIPQTYRHLEIRYACRSEGSATDLLMRFNNDSGSNYNVQVMRGAGTGTTAATLSAVAQANIASVPASGGTFDGIGRIHIPYYAQGTLTRSATCEYSLNDGVNNQVGVFAAMWTGTAAITRITLFLSALDLKEASIFSLYGIS